MRRKTIGRRAFLGGAAATVAAVGGASLGWALLRDSDDESAADATPTPFSTTPGPSATPVATPAATRPPTGGGARLAARTSFVFDTFDAALSGEPSVVEVLGRTHRRVLQWASFEAGVLGPGFASQWEQASPTSLLLTLRDDSWPAGSDLDSRPVTADDLVEHLERIVALASGNGLPLSQAPWTYGSIAHVEAVDGNLVRIETHSPDPFLVEALASRFAVVQRPEVIERYGDELSDLHPEHVIGTGDFLYRGFEEGALSFDARPGGDALLDTLAVVAAGQDAASFIAGERRGIPGSRPSRRTRDSRRTRQPRQRSARLRGQSGRFDVCRRGATLERPEPRCRNLGRSQPQLAHRRPLWRAGSSFGHHCPGLRRVLPARRCDPRFLGGIRNRRRGFEATEARATWEAAGGPALGPITLDVPAIFDPLYSAAESVAGRLATVLSAEVQPAIVSYTDIAERLASGYYGNGRAAFWLGWSSPLEGPDPSRWLRNQFHSTSASATAAGFQDSDVDALLDRLATEFLAEERSTTVAAIVDHLASGQGGFLSFALQTAEQFVRAPVEGRVNSPFWSQHLDAAVFRGRNE